MVRLDMSETQPESIMLNFCLPFLVPVVSTMCLYLSLFSTTCLQAGKDVSIRFGLWYVSICVARFLVLGILVNSSWKSSLGQVSTALHKWCRSVTIQAFHQVLPVRSGHKGKPWPWGTLSRCWWRVWWCLPDVCVFSFRWVGRKWKHTKDRLNVKDVRCVFARSWSDLPIEHVLPILHWYWSTDQLESEMQGLAEQALIAIL